MTSTPRNKTPQTNFTKTPRRLIRQSAVQETPDCFNLVQVETPVISKKRRSSKHKLDETNNLAVAVRIRPMNSRELASASVYDVISAKDNEITVNHLIPGAASVNVTHSFQYDHVFWSVNSESLQYSDQNDVFTTLGKPMLDSVFKGYNACLFAYGQTGSGKSYSMMGEDIENSDSAGVIPRFCSELFKRINNLNELSVASVEVSYFEIYNEKIHDLLAITNSSVKKNPLKVREHPTWGPYVENLSQNTVKSYNEMFEWVKIGNKNRATAATVMNEKSSRSHSIFTIELTLSEMSQDGDNLSRRSKVSLVDLAGSERLNNTSINDERHRQGVSINRSLLTLGKVISALADQKKNTFIPYRDSILTWLLRESLGGNSLTTMLATISPASTHVEETLATLRYACQARAIINRAHINEDPNDRLIRELRAEVERLRARRREYERTSLCQSVCENDSSLQELEELRNRLSETEKDLEVAQNTRQKQIREIAEAEKKKEELASHIRVMSTMDPNVILSPYKSNFLEEIQKELTLEDTKEIAIEEFKHCCISYGLFVEMNEDHIVIKNIADNAQAISHISEIANLDNFEHFLTNLEWEQIGTKPILAKDTVNNYLQQIQCSISGLKHYLSDNENLIDAYNRVTESLKDFETELNKVRSHSPSISKMVTFKFE